MRYHERRLEPTLKDPLAAAVRLSRDAGFDQHVLYEANGCWSFAGGALRAITVDRRGARWTDEPPDERADPFAQIARRLRTPPIEGWRAYGWIAFECGDPDPDPDERADPQPLMHLVIPEVEVRMTPAQTLIRAADPDAVARLAALIETARSADSGSDSGPDPGAETRPRPAPPSLDEPLQEPCDEDGAGFRAGVADAIDAIATSDLRKVVISRRVTLRSALDFAATYERGRRANTPARSFLVHLGGLRAVGFSPETILEIDRLTATAHVLAGTRAMGTDPETTERLRRSLLDDPKEVYEHAVSVAAALEDLTGICRPGSTAVTRFMSVRQRGSVQHLASTMAGELPTAASPWDALAAMLPGSAATGAPRDLARQAIRRIEPQPRGLYGGAVLTCDADGALDAALALRTVFSQGGTTWLQAGAGITSQSRPDREYEETREKLRTVAPFLVTDSADTEPAPTGSRAAPREQR